MYKRYNANNSNDSNDSNDPTELSKNNNICKDQTSYNKAFKKALNTYNLNENECKTDICRVKNTVFSIIILVFYLWALLLASKVKDKEHRIIHFVFALLSGPIYVLSYYCSSFTLEQ
jgi:hypothetical protein